MGAAEAAREWLIELGIVGRTLTECVLGGDADVTRQLWTNALALVVGRTVVVGGENAIELRCPRCGATFEPGSNWLEAVDAWAEGDDEARYACPSCGVEQPLRQWSGPSPWGFGQLGFE